MKFNQIIFSGIKYDISGIFNFEQCGQCTLLIDVEESNYQSLLNVFFEGNDLSQYIQISHPNSLVLINSQKTIYISKPLMSYHSKFFNSGFYKLSDLRSTSCEYFSIGSSIDPYEELFNCYTVSSKVGKGFMEAFEDLKFMNKDGINKKVSIFSFRQTSITLYLYPNELRYEYFLDIEIRADSSKDFEFFESIYHSILELLSLVAGHSPSLIQRKLDNDNKSVTLYLIPVEKHTSYRINRPFFPLLSISTSTILQEQVLLNYERKKDYFGAIFDILLFLLNSDLFQDIKANMYVHLIAGFQKSKNNNTATSYEHLFNAFDNEYTRQLLVDRDKHRFNEKGHYSFLSKAKNHRNYFSHLFNKQIDHMFTPNESAYANIKLSACIRINILLQLNIKPDKFLIKNIVDYADYVLGQLPNS